MDRSQKEQLVSEYGEIFSAALAGVLVEYQGATVEELTTLRKSLFGQQSKFRVMKNSLAKLAVQGTPYEGLADHFKGTRAFVYSTEDVIAAAKVMTESAKTNDKYKIVAGCLVNGAAGEILDAKGVEALSKMPSREELVAKLLYVLNAPITQFVRTLNEVPASFVRLLQAYADSK